MVAVGELVPAGVRPTVEDLRELPLYEGDIDDDEQRPASVGARKRRIAEADVLLVAASEHDYAISGEPGRAGPGPLACTPAAPR